MKTTKEYLVQFGHNHKEHDVISGLGQRVNGISNIINRAKKIILAEPWTTKEQVEIENLLKTPDTITITLMDEGK